MKWTINLLIIKGIDVKVHLTFILILVWAAFRWSGSTGSGLQGALFGVVVTLLLFVAVLLHELGHSFQALKFGVRVKNITLLPLGGMAQMDELPKKPRQELRIALAGPLVNFAIAGLLAALAFVLQTRSVVSLSELTQSLGKASWAGMLSYLTMANLGLGVFNLIPAFPMDGGRILRALLALRLDYAKATQIAARIGQAFAFLIGGWGALTGSYNLVLIAIFIWLAAGQERKDVQVKDVLGDIRVGDAMTRSPLTLHANDSLSRAVDLTLSTSQSVFPVLEWGTNTVVGMLCEKELVKGLKSDQVSAPVRELMITTFPTATADVPLSQTLQRMLAGRVRSLPVIDRQGQLEGLLTVDDVNEAYRLLSAGLKFAPAAP